LAGNPCGRDVVRWVALAIFIAAGVTDILDGYFARSLGQQSSFGRMLDPIADKLLVASCLLMLAADETIRAGRCGPRSSFCAAKSWFRACVSTLPNCASAAGDAACQVEDDRSACRDRVPPCRKAGDEVVSFVTERN